MRELKFRGKIIDCRTELLKALGYKVGDWIYGENISVDHNDINPDKIHVFICRIKVDPETVGQCIGIKDYDEYDVFDGDIIQDKDDATLGIVYWDKEDAAFNIEFDSCIVSAKDVSYYQVIGNKWNNPELLKEWERQRGY